MAAADPAELARIIAVKCYGVEPRIEPLSRLDNAVFRLHFPAGSRILKLAAGSDGGSIRKEVMLIELLGRRGIPVPAIEHEDAGAKLVGRPYFIMSSAGDRTAADWAQSADPTARRLFAAMGSVLGRIHAVTFPSSGDIRAEGVVPRDLREFLRGVYDLADRTAAQGILEPGEVARFKSLPPPPLGGRQLCHGDFHAVQCIVREGSIGAVVDWESAWAGNALVDLAVAQAYLEYYALPELTRCFLGGYASECRLPQDYEAAYLPVRMAQALGLIRVCQARGLRENLRRAVDLFRTYCGRPES